MPGCGREKKMIRKKFVLCFLFSVWLCNMENAYAYLDPGTGSMLLQSILGIFLVIGTGAGIFWGKIKRLFNRSEDSDKKNR
jgi:hypothetical protein